MDSYDLDILQGATFDLALTVTDDNGGVLDLTGYSVRGSARTRYASGVIFDIPCQIPTPESGILTIQITPTGTEVLLPTQMVYSIEAYKDSDTLNLLRGYLNVYPEVPHA